MFPRRLATAAVLFALFGAACASHGGTTVAAGASSSTQPGASIATTTSTTATTLPPTAALPTTAAPTQAEEAPVEKTPEPASIEVDYQPHDGDSAVATLTGPNGTHSKPLDSGAALFGGLPAGTYAVTISIKSAAVPESSGTGIDSAVQILNGNSVHVEPGDHGVITCTDEGCAGAL